MTKQVPRPLLTMAIALAIGVASIITVSWLLQWLEVSGPVRLMLAMVPVAAFVFMIVSYLQLVREADEMQKRIHLEALAIAFPSSVVAVFACEYLRKGGFLTQFKPDYALMLMLVLWALGYLIAWRRYQ